MTNPNISLMVICAPKMIIVLPRLKQEGTGYQRQPDEVRIEFYAVQGCIYIYIHMHTKTMQTNSTLSHIWMSLVDVANEHGGDTVTHEHADMAWSTNQQTWICGGMWAQGFKHVQIKCPKTWYRDRG